MLVVSGGGRGGGGACRWLRQSMRSCTPSCSVIHHSPVHALVHSTAPAFFSAVRLAISPRRAARAAKAGSA
eukprot:scaffold38409_cov57-Phaeocystis_antarctica.AAC.3